MVGVTAVGSAVALASACAPAAAPTTQPTAQAAPTVAPTPLKIGVLLPYTESSIGVDIGLNQKRAADLYLKQRDGMLGGRTVDLVYSAESIEAAINKVKVQTLTEKDNVDLLIGGASSESASVLRDAALAAKMVYLATNATASALTRDSKYVFRSSATAWQVSEPLGEWASANGHREFYVCGNDAESMDAFAVGLAKNGGAVVTRNVNEQAADLSQLVSNIAAQSAKNVFAALSADDAENFLKEWHKQSLSASGYTLFGPGALTDEEVLTQVKDAALSTTTSLFWSPDLDNAENKALVEAFPGTYTDDDTGEPVGLNGYAVEMWDAMTALDLALRQAGANTDALIAALEGVAFKSPRGAFAFDKATHTPVQDIYIRQVVSAGASKPANRVLARIPSVAASSSSG